MPSANVQRGSRLKRDLFLDVTLTPYCHGHIREFLRVSDGAHFEFEVKHYSHWTPFVPKRKVYKLAYREYGREQMFAEGVSGQIILSEHVSTMSARQYRRIARKTGFDE